MGVFQGIFKKEKKDEQPKVEDYAEIPDDSNEQKKTKIMIEKLDGLMNVDNIIKKVREGNIVLVRIKELREHNLDELKQCTGKLKTVISNMNGDIAGVSDEWLVVTPSTATVVREA